MSVGTWKPQLDPTVHLRAQWATRTRVPPLTDMLTDWLDAMLSCEVLERASPSSLRGLCANGTFGRLPLSKNNNTLHAFGHSFRSAVFKRLPLVRFDRWCTHYLDLDDLNTIALRKTDDIVLGFYLQPSFSDDARVDEAVTIQWSEAGADEAVEVRTGVFTWALRGGFPVLPRSPQGFRVVGPRMSTSLRKRLFVVFCRGTPSTPDMYAVRMRRLNGTTVTYDRQLHEEMARQAALPQRAQGLLTVPSLHIRDRLQFVEQVVSTRPKHEIRFEC